MLRIALFALTIAAVLSMLDGVLWVLAAVQAIPPGWIHHRVHVLEVTAAVAVVGGLGSLLLSRRLARWSTGARLVTRPRSYEEARLLSTVAELAQQAGIACPDLAIYESSRPNAFSVGWRRDGAMLAVSTGLLTHLSPNEIEAVLAHEVSHIESGDMVTLALMQGVLDTFVLLAARAMGRVVDRAILRIDHGCGPSYWMTTIVAELLWGLLATLVVLAFSRHRELRADAGARDLVGAPAMISALRRLARAPADHELPPSLRAFGIRGGFCIARSFGTHPAFAERLARLRPRPR